MKNLLGGEALMQASRTPEILADAAHALFCLPAREITGRFLIDDSFPGRAGVTDFSKYRVTPGIPLAPDFFVPDASTPPPGPSPETSRVIFIHQPVAGAGQTLLERRSLELQEPIPDDTVWLDMVRPSREEDLKVEVFMGISVPTREEMKDIEPSELLYVEDGARYMTGRVLSKVSEAEEPGSPASPSSCAAIAS